RLADVNNDNALDIVFLVAVAGGGGAIDVLLGNGNGTFSGPQTTSLPTAAMFLALADFNGDGHIDCTYANRDNSVYWRFGNGDGTFGGENSAMLGGQVSEPVAGQFSATTADIIALTYNSTQNTYQAVQLKNNGTGGFGAPVRYSIPSSPMAMVAGDLDN